MKFDYHWNSIQKVLIFAGFSQFELLCHPDDRMTVKKIRLASMILFLTAFVEICFKTQGKNTG